MKVEKMLVNPASGVLVYNLQGIPIEKKVKGNPVPRTAFYNRLKKEGALVELGKKKKIIPTTPAKPVPAKPKTKTKPTSKS